MGEGNAIRTHGSTGTDVQRAQSGDCLGSVEGRCCLFPSVAFVYALLLQGGYLRVGMDGPDVESECIPLHCTSPFMFPVGYAEKYGIRLGGPNGNHCTDEFTSIVPRTV